MLTATYALVGLSVEQAAVRVGLLAFQKHVHGTWLRQQSISLAQLQYACDSLRRLHQNNHWRKVHSYLIPAVRLATRQADRLLDELEQLHRDGLELVAGLQARAGQLAARPASSLPARQACGSIDQFCRILLQRLDHEELQLLSVARNVLNGEAWFAIANHFLRHDAELAEMRRLPGAMMHAVSARAAGAAALPRLADGAPPAAAAADLTAEQERQHKRVTVD